MRIAEIFRETKETKIYLQINIDGKGESSIDTPIPFLNHMLESFSKHGFFDIKLEAKGDIEIGHHHLIEDIGLVFGKGIKEALSDKKGIKRYGFFILPMDESLVKVAIDICGRSYLYYRVDFQGNYVGEIDCTLFWEFFKSLSNESKITLHIEKERGYNSHHIVEAIFKCFAKALDIATTIDYKKDKNNIPSTKGVL